MYQPYMYFSTALGDENSIDSAMIFNGISADDEGTGMTLYKEDEISLNAALGKK